jgi:hypothetical protein
MTAVVGIFAVSLVWHCVNRRSWASSSHAGDRLFRSSSQLRKEVSLNDTPVVVSALAVALLLVVLALVREARLRRALQQLLAKLLIHWRQKHAEAEPSAPRGTPGSLAIAFLA